AATPGSGLVAYAGTDGNGVYATNDGGRSWHQENGGNATLAGEHVSGLAIDPWNARVVYAAGGDGTIFKSADGGAIWSAQALPVGSQINALALDPLSSST